jgi:hypothetical protein
VGSTAVLFGLLSIANSTFDHLFKHSSPALRLKLESSQSFVGVHPAHQIRQGANLLSTNTRVFVS